MRVLILISTYRLIVIVLLRSVNFGRGHAAWVFMRPLRYRLDFHLIHYPLHLIHDWQLWWRRRSLILNFKFVGGKSVGLIVILLRGSVRLRFPLLKFFNIQNHLFQKVSGLFKWLPLLYPFIVQLLFNVFPFQVMVGITECFDWSSFSINFLDKFPAGFKKTINLFSYGRSK